MALSKVEAKRQRDILFQKFLSRVTTHKAILGGNGFIAVGKLKTPKDHVIPKINDVLMWIVGGNEDGSKIVVLNNLNMTMDEAKIIPTAFIGFLKQIADKEKEKKIQKKRNDIL